MISVGLNRASDIFFIGVKNVYCGAANLLGRAEIASPKSSSQ